MRWEVSADRQKQLKAITDDGMKKSATGRLAVHRGPDGRRRLIQGAAPEQEADQELVTVFEDGRLGAHQSFAAIRARLRAETADYERGWGR